MSENYSSQKSKSSIAPGFIVLSLVILGVALQIAQYLANRNLRLDEAQFAMNLIDKSHLQLLGPMDNSQNSPLLFLMLLKTFLVFAGYSEYALRFIPIVSGVISIPLLYILAASVAYNANPGNDRPSLKTLLLRPEWSSAIIACSI